MIDFRDMSFAYKNGENGEGLQIIYLHIPKGQVVLLCGESGCGKTTLTRLVNGLIPHFYEGELSGTVTVGGMDPAAQSVQKTSALVGSVFQNPRSQFFTVDTASELAFACENRGWQPADIRSRVAGVSGEFELDTLLGRSLFQLSGGEKQRIACASVAAPKPEVFVLDEPSSNLDIQSIRKLADILRQLKAQGKTILIAEHRLAWLMDIVDRVVVMRSGRIERDMPVQAFAALPHSETEEMGLRARKGLFFAANSGKQKEALKCSGFRFERDKKVVLDIPELSIPQGAVVGILGDNGAGKTTLARCLCGLERKAKGELVTKAGRLTRKQRLQRCYIVMQDVNHQLFTESVLDEVAISLPGSLTETEKQQRAENILRGLNLWQVKDRHPQSLSGGQKQRVAIAGAMASGKDIIVYDEPTSGLDLRHMREVAAILRDLSQTGATQLVITHDPELVCHSCNHIVFMEYGCVRWRGPLNEECTQRVRGYFSGSTYEETHPTALHGMGIMLLPNFWPKGLMPGNGLE